MYLSGVIESVERAPYEAFIRFQSTNLKTITNLTVAGCQANLLPHLKSGNRYGITCYVWLAVVTKSYSTPRDTYFTQIDGQNGTEMCGPVSAVVGTETLFIDIGGESVKVELEEAHGVSIGEFAEIRGELHAEL